MQQQICLILLFIGDSYNIIQLSGETLASFCHRYEMNDLSRMVGVKITELAECYNLFPDRVYLSSPVAFTIAIFASVCMLCGTPSNLKIVLLYFVKSDFLGTFTSAYTLLLALSDISMMLILMPCIFILFGRNVLKQKLHFGVIDSVSFDFLHSPFRTFNSLTWF